MRWHFVSNLVALEVALGVDELAGSSAFCKTVCCRKGVSDSCRGFWKREKLDATEVEIRDKIFVFDNNT